MHSKLSLGKYSTWSAIVASLVLIGTAVGCSGGTDEQSQVNPDGTIGKAAPSTAPPPNAPKNANAPQAMKGAEPAKPPGDANGNPP